MSAQAAFDYTRYWHARKQLAALMREPLYVTPEEYQALREWESRLEAEYERRFGPRMSKVPGADEPRSSHDAMFSTQVVVDRAERDRQLGEVGES